MGRFLVLARGAAVLAAILAQVVYAEDPWADVVVSSSLISPNVGFGDVSRAVGEPVGSCRGDTSR